MSMRVFVRARVRDGELQCARASSESDVCEECKVRGRRGPKRVDRASQHIRWEEVMCNNARPMYMHDAATALPDNITDRRFGF